MPNEPVFTSGPDLKVGRLYRLELTAHSYFKVMRIGSDGLVDIICFNLFVMDGVNNMTLPARRLRGYECELSGNDTSESMLLKVRYISEEVSNAG